MENVKHTPGPWKVETKKSEWECNRGIPIYKNFVQIARVILFDSKTVCPEESQANARLIAAAPELLEACKEALEHFDKYTKGIVIDAKDSLRMAIAKAEGKNA
jgi:hypothetical protein